MSQANMKRVKELIRQSVQYLSEAELLEENGWTQEDVQLLDYILKHDFDIRFLKHNEIQ